ncbi:MAG: hypothetical protein [Caudoviricetes sp.]|nr:MAG: hypothetical protein [Caudoviricetes sp.]
MLTIKSSDKGSVYLFDNIVLMTYHNEKQEASIPKASVKIYGPDICREFLRDAFLFSKDKNRVKLIGRIIEIGGDFAYHYDIKSGCRESSVKMTEQEMMFV